MRIRLVGRFDVQSISKLVGMPDFIISKLLKNKPVDQRHQMVSDSLALLFFFGLDLLLGSREAGPIGDEVL